MRSRVLSTARIEPAPTDGALAATETTPTHPHPPRLLVLLADSTIPEVKEVYGDYHDIFCDLFSKSLVLAKSDRARRKEAGSGTGEDLQLEVRSFDARNGEYPDREELDAATGVLITGSAASAYEPQPWIIELTNFTSSIVKTHRHVKIFGICFGHQIVSLAFGGKVEKNSEGWELGVRTLDLTPLGRRVLARGKGAGGVMEVEEHIESKQETVRIFQVHQDHVPSVPAGFELLGSTPICAVQGMLRRSKPSSSADVSLTDISVLAVQGHPEFLPDLVIKLVDSRERRGILSAELAEESRGYAREHDDGVWLGRVCLAVMGI